MWRQEYTFRCCFWDSISHWPGVCWGGKAGQPLTELTNSAFLLGFWDSHAGPHAYKVNTLHTNQHSQTCFFWISSILRAFLAAEMILGLGEPVRTSIFTISEASPHWRSLRLDYYIWETHVNKRSSWIYFEKMCCVVWPPREARPLFCSQSGTTVCVWCAGKREETLSMEPYLRSMHSFQKHPLENRFRKLSKCLCFQGENMLFYRASWNQALSRVLCAPVWTLHSMGDTFTWDTDIAFSHHEHYAINFQQTPAEPPN